MTTNQELRTIHMIKDKASFEAFYNKYEYFLFNIAYKLTGDKDQSEVLLTKVFKRIKEHPSDLFEASTKNPTFTLFELTVRVHKENCQDLYP